MKKGRPSLENRSDLNLQSGREAELHFLQLPIQDERAGASRFTKQVSIPNQNSVPIPDCEEVLDKDSRGSVSSRRSIIGEIRIDWGTITWLEAVV